MCGLIAAFNFGKTPNPVNEAIIHQYEEQYMRGTRGFGIIRLNKNCLEIDRACEPTKFLMDLYLKKSNMIIAHHRTPTSTDNYMDQTHPMIVSNDQLAHDYYIVHNGIVLYDKLLHDKHLELGFKYTTEYESTSQYNTTTKIIKWNDSESLAIEVAMFLENKITAMGFDNNAAFIALQVNKKTQKPTRVFFARHGNGSDLQLYQINNKIRISSEGFGMEVEDNKIFSFNPNSKMPRIEEAPAVYEQTKPATQTVIHTPTTVQTFGFAPPTPAPTQTTLPASTTQNNVVATETPKESQKRSWHVHNFGVDEYAIPEFCDKNYFPKVAVAMKDSLRTCKDTTEIFSALETTLEEMADNTTEMIHSFKDTILTDKLELNEHEFWTTQIETLLKGMQIVTNIADATFKEQAALEAQIDREEITGYTPTTKQGTHNTEDKYHGIPTKYLEEMDARD